ncbi:MAG: hypothetical protein AB1540_17380, partial [Bdellovibrionota bacterium]
MKKFAFVFLGLLLIGGNASASSQGFSFQFIDKTKVEKAIGSCRKAANSLKSKLQLKLISEIKPHQDLARTQTEALLARVRAKLEEKELASLYEQGDYDRKNLDLEEIQARALVVQKMIAQASQETSTTLWREPQICSESTLGRDEYWWRGLYSYCGGKSLRPGEEAEPYFLNYEDEDPLRGVFFQFLPGFANTFVSCVALDVPIVDDEIWGRLAWVSKSCLRYTPFHEPFYFPTDYSYLIRRKNQDYLVLGRFDSYDPSYIKSLEATQDGMEAVSRAMELQCLTDAYNEIGQTLVSCSETKKCSEKDALTEADNLK